MIKAKIIFSRIFIVVFFLLFIAAVHYGFFLLLMKSEALTVREIIVRNNKFVSKENVIYLSGIKMGSSILAIDLVEVAKKLQNYPFIKKAEVKRILPDKIEVILTENEPVVNFAINGEYYLLGENGAVIIKGFYEKIPVLELDFSVGIENGILKDDFVCYILKNLGDFDGLSNISKLVVKKNSGVYVFLKGLQNVTFYLGKKIPDKNLLDKIFLMAEKIKNEGIKVNFVDLRSENALGF
jgi:hypothetical protein